MRNLIVAIGKNNLIGKDNDLPWHYKEDLQGNSYIQEQWNLYMKGR